MSITEQNIFTLYEFALTAPEFELLAKIAQIPLENRELHRDFLNSIFGHYRFQSALYKRTGIGADVTRDFDRVIAAGGALARRLSTWEVRARLASMALADGEYPEISSPGDGERAIAEARRSVAGLIRWGRAAKTLAVSGREQTRALVGAKNDPNGRILVAALLRYWRIDLKRETTNSLIETKPGKRSAGASPLTRFVAESLRIVGARRSLEAVRKEIDRTRTRMDENERLHGVWTVMTPGADQASCGEPSPGSADY